MEKGKAFIKCWIRWTGRLATSHLAGQQDLAFKSACSLKVAQRQLFAFYQQLSKTGQPLPSIKDAGYRVFSQFDEDGIFVFLFAVLGAPSRTFADIGSTDGINSNCANLALNFGWHGVFIDGNAGKIDYGRKFYAEHPDTWAYPPKFVCGIVQRSNINELIHSAGIKGELDLLSIDIDGNDYWIWDALTAVQPRVVVIETHMEFGYENIVVPYDENYVYPGRHPEYHGASPVAMRNLARKLGYRLVGANLYGFNLIFVRNDVGADIIPECTLEEALRHPRNPERFKIFEQVRHFPYQAG